MCACVRGFPVRGDSDGPRNARGCCLVLLVSNTEEERMLGYCAAVVVVVDAAAVVVGEEEEKQQVQKSARERAPAFESDSIPRKSRRRSIALLRQTIAIAIDALLVLNLLPMLLPTVTDDDKGRNPAILPRPLLLLLLLLLLLPVVENIVVIKCVSCCLRIITRLKE